MTNQTDAQRRRGLRRMKAGAFCLLVLAGVIFGLTYLGDGEGWVGFVRAGSEAAMVGGLADWFAVTALFRHPLGLPIPHTALIPRRKDQIGESLGGFVRENFLSEDVVVARLRDAELVQRLGGWIADEANATRVADELTGALRGALTDAGVGEVVTVMSTSALARLQEVSYAPIAGRVLAELLADDRHRPLVDILVTSTRRWMESHPQVAVHSLQRVSPGAIPKFLRDPAVARIYAKACDLAREVERDPHHELRASVDELLNDYARRLQHDPATAATFDRLVHQSLGHPSTAIAVGDLVTRALTIAVELAQEQDGPVRTALLSRITSLGTRMRDDVEFSAALQESLERIVSHVVTTYGNEISKVISDTVARWDAEETTRRIELQIGRDLQFIRINGTVVGALAGLAIHTVTVVG